MFPTADPPKTAAWNRNRLIAGALLLLCAGFYVAAINTSLYQWGDNAHYMIVAESIATGEGFRDIHTPGHPRFQYPIPLFPLTLAPIVAGFGYELLPLKLFVALTAVVAIWLGYLLYRRLLDHRFAAILTVMLAVSPQFVSFSHQVMTECPYTALAIGALLLTLRLAERETRRTGLDIALLVVALSAACLTRSLGLALVLGSATYLLIDGHGTPASRASRSAVVLVACFAAWAAAMSLLGSPYLGEFLAGTVHPAAAHESPLLQRLVERVGVNLHGYAAAVPETVLYLIYEQPSRWLMAGVLAIIGLGYGFCLARKRSPIEYYIAFYALVLIFYEPSNSGNLRRYVVPLIPFGIYYFAIGLQVPGSALERLTRNIRPRLGRELISNFAFGLLCVIAALNFVATARASLLHRTPEMFDYDRYVDADGYRRMGEWVRAHTPADSIVSTERTYIFHIWARRQTVWPPQLGAAHDDDVIADLRRGGVDFVTVQGFPDPGTQALRAFFKRNQASFTPVYSANGDEVYRLSARDPVSDR